MDSSAIDFVASTRRRDIPDAVAVQVRRCLLDLVGVAAAGSATELSRIARGHARSQFAAGEVGASLFFDGRSVSPAGAALANAMTIDAFDAHDGHPLTKGHAGCGLFPAIAAVAEAEGGVTGAEFLTLIALGYEIAIRAGIALHRTAADYHTSGAWVAVAAAALCGRVLGLGRTRMREAMGIAEYHGPRSQMMRCIDHPTMVKDGSGWGAMAGVSAAYLARDGFTGAPALTAEAEEVADIWDDLGSRWRILECYFKPYPVCRWAQPAIEAGLQALAATNAAGERITGITVHTFHEASRLAKARPATTEEAQYSLAFSIAAALVKGDVGPAEISGPALRDPEILRLSEAVRLVEDPAFNARFPAERWARIELHMEDGSIVRSGPASARGDADTPLSDGEIAEKFHALMAVSGLGERVGAVEDLVANLDEAASVTPLLEAISRPPEASEPRLVPNLRETA
ncbi:MmgE/PrpD family protein [Aurantimonas sp. A3-2-R12]|uniref:MmgE/PrpD family protein n=1 Tax=Aurantimonas sp. A3-2-R12 TaxID=3114362 RepID=UPI002E19BE22|nr:MmgE/PrpD family protein [Aurantimonas sp. A3-2-R12]